MKIIQRIVGIFQLGFILISVGCSQGTFPPVESNDETKAPIPVIIDTDMAIDDWLAILYILQNQKADVLAISVTGAGEAYCAEGMRNAMYLLRLSGKQKSGIKVACGDSEPLDGYNVFPQAWRDDVNSLYGLPIPTDLPKPSDVHAVDVLLPEIRRSKTPVSIVTLGNVTNIAQLLQRDPSIVSNIQKIYIMGGAIRAKGNIIVPGFTDNNLNTVAEWNIYVDPLAAQIVLRADVDKALIPLDATNLVKVTPRFAAKFKRNAVSESARFFDQVLDRNKGFIDSGEYYFWDPLTAVYALDDSICKSESSFVDVIVQHAADAGPNTQGHYSQFRSDGQARATMDPAIAGKTIISDKPLGKQVDICMYPDVERFKSELIKGLNRQ